MGGACRSRSPCPSAMLAAYPARPRLSATPANGRFLLTMQLRRLEAAEQDIDALDLRIAERLERSTSFHQFRC